MSETQPPNQLQTLWDQAAQLQLRGDSQAAMDLYSQMIDLDPKCVPAYVERGIISIELGQPEKAMRDFKRALQIDPQYGPAYYGRGWVRHLKGDFEGEIQDARRGLLLDRDNAGMYYGRLGAAQQALGDYEKAIESYDRAVKFYGSGDPGTLYNRGLCLAEMEEYEAAMADFDRSLELRPGWAQALRARGNARLMLGSPEQAVADCSLAIQHQPDYLQAYLTRGQAYQALGDAHSARADFEHIAHTTTDRRQRIWAQDLLSKLGE